MVNHLEVRPDLRNNTKLQKIGGMATMPSRRETLLKSLSSILAQIDHLYLYFDKYTSVPDEFRNVPKITCLLQKQGGRSLGCSGKFYGLKLHPKECLYFCFDDDISYPEDYVRKLTNALSKNFFKAVVGVHGAIFKANVKSYAKDKVIIPFSSGVQFDILVDEIGTGTIAFHSRIMKIDPEKWNHANMSDLYMMLSCLENQVPRVCIRRPPNYLTALSSFQDDSIYVNSLKDDKAESELLSAYLRETPNCLLLADR